MANADLVLAERAAREKRPLTISAAKLLASVAIGLILLFLLLPTLIVIPMSVGTSPYIEFPPHGLTLSWYEAYVTDPGAAAVPRRETRPFGMNHALT